MTFKRFAAQMTTLTLLSGIAACGIPEANAAVANHATGDTMSKELQPIATSTWKFFKTATNTPTNLPVDRIDIDDKGRPVLVGTNTSPTNIGMYFLALASAKDLGQASANELSTRLNRLLKTLDGLEKWNGFLYNWYDTHNGSVVSSADAHFVSTVDNGWYAAGLIVARQAFPDSAARITKLLNQMNFSLLYDSSIGQMYGGYDAAKKQLPNWHFGNLNTESRVADYIAIGLGNVPRTLWWKVYRTLPADWTWQHQVPQGKNVVHEGVSVFEGHYSWGKTTFVPSWGGSMFESLMPTMVLDEQTLSPHGFGLNDKRMVDLQIQYESQKHYPAWGISPCATPNDGYGVYGVPELSTSPYSEDGTITPHASFLALNFEPAAALKNLAALRKKYAMVGPYGYYDSVNVKTNAVTHSYLTLDEGMILVSIDNALRKGKIQGYFLHDPIGKRPRTLLTGEDFGLN